MKPIKNTSRNSGAGGTLDMLEVFDRLEVGPVKVEPARIVAPYRVVAKSGKNDSLDLVYKYEEDVFDPGEPASVNLANMIAAQVALNYGLFCRRIVFRGPDYSDIDRRFIQDMAENTAREIYVKKFLEPNPFLVGKAAGLEPERQRKYLRAAVEFPDVPPGVGKVPWQYWSTSRHHHAVLSSGGKDSLLSHGLLDEIGREVHPIFINESGRHWFTALNAYRHFAAVVPNTARVWVSSDRVFAWMLRHLPFVRPDFASVRSDEYPIRLWTVAVFLFGALPLMRKRGIGRLVIGDEYDTTERTSFRGITHYNALYDQSRYFDNAMSRYFMRKGWGVSQFSLLRPLSEMLIEKILVERYPRLQEHQVSCHAAHRQDDGIRPCGRCEKCRRIVGMLKAIGADPGQCGYTAAMVSDCLKELAVQGVHQEAPGARHLLFMLKQKGLITGTEGEAREHPEILSLRFDPERSPVESVPADLREPLYRIFLEHAGGALRRSGKRWAAFDVLKDPSMAAHYPFDPDLKGPAPHDAGGRARQETYLYGELTWQEAAQHLDEVDVALLPVGALEQHGPHLPLDTDAFDAWFLARQVAAACSDPRPLVLPSIPYGVSYHHEGFRGTISINNETLSRLVYDIGMGAARNGVRKLVIINGHGGNGPALNYAAQMINRDARIFACVDTGETSDVDIEKFIETSNDVHAGEIETSTALATRPHLVKMELAEKSVPEFSSRYLNFSSKRGVVWYAFTERISPSGVMGDPTKASVEKGEMIWHVMIAHLVAFVEDLKRMTLEEIYQRRY